MFYMSYMYIPPHPSESSGFPGSPAGCVGDALPLKPANCQLRWMAFELNGNMTGWWCNNHLEKYEFVNGFRMIRMTTHIKNGKSSKCLKDEHGDYRWLQYISKFT